VIRAHEESLHLFSGSGFWGTAALNICPLKKLEKFVKKSCISPAKIKGTCPAERRQAFKGERGKLEHERSLIGLTGN